MSIETTPMMRQYWAIKEQYKDAILFYRLGDFYEMFHEDALVASKILNLTLTSRNKNMEDSVPLCGVPFHSAQGYINKLLAQGYKVALCEQVEDPQKAKGIVKREVVSVLSPGLVLDTHCLEAAQKNYLVALSQNGSFFGLAKADVSIGSFAVTQFDSLADLVCELERISPKEIVIEKKENSPFDFLQNRLPTVRLARVSGFNFEPDFATEALASHYKIDFQAFGFHSQKAALQASGALLLYLKDNKFLKEKLLDRPTYYEVGAAMLLDEMTLKNLELTKTIHQNEKYGSLLWLLDKTKTPMGARTLREWLLYPLNDKVAINHRLDVLEELLLRKDLLAWLQEELSLIVDLERIANRALSDLAHPRELKALAQSLTHLPGIQNTLSSLKADWFLTQQYSFLELDSLAEKILQTLVDDPPLVLKEGGMIRDGAHELLDELKSIERDGKSTISNLEAKERESTGISSLKIRYNRVFGYYIEITHTHKNKIPSHYIRKQTLTQAERYITPELKEYEDKILGASARIVDLEYELFIALRREVAHHLDQIKQVASSLAQLDALLSLAFVAYENSYVRPVIVDEPVLLISQGRHPLIERLHRDEPFVPNDIFLSPNDCCLMMLTGPNMAGKSTLMRQCALIVLMAQMGSYVPAKEVKMGLADRIFTRIGASDHLQKGQSTFMVEMLETATILNNATRDSLILMDEIGRGTSTFDGLSIAWAVAETLHDRIKARSLFATHYHELTDLASTHPGIKNYHMEVREWNGEVRFLRTLKEGGVNRSYGVFVAAMAGLPASTISRAKEILKILEQNDLRFQKATHSNLQVQTELFDVPSHPLIEELKTINLDTLTPLEALNLLHRYATKSA